MNIYKHFRVVLVLFGITSVLLFVLFALSFFSPKSLPGRQAGYILDSIFSFPVAHAATINWIGAGADENWTTGANWSGGRNELT